MKRDLLIQMKNEWRNNLWLTIGLAIVSLSIWVLGNSLYKVIYPTFFSRGFDPENVFTAQIATIDNANEASNEEEDSYSVNLRNLLAVLRSNENVEAVALSRNANPYQMSLWGNSIGLAGKEKDTIGYAGNMRWGSPDIAKVLRLESRTGKSIDDIEEILKKDGVLVSNVVMPLVIDPDTKERRTPEELYGKNVEWQGEEYRVGDIINFVKRSDYTADTYGTIFFGLDESQHLDNIWSILIRVKPGRMESFKQQFESDASLRQYKNVYLSQMTKLTDEGVATDRDKTVEARMYTVVIILLIVIIFLGMLGTFWFRMQERVSEIAIRKVCGASSGDIFRRVISEGLLLVVFATVLAAIAGWVIMKVTDVADGLPYESVVLTEVMTMILVVVGIVVSIWYPARRAMKIEPAIAIKAE